MNPLRLPPFWFLLAVGAQFALAWTERPPAENAWRVGAGAAVVALGAAAVLGAFASFVRAGTPVRPFARPERLITSGLFRFSRNPLYLGEAIMLVGLAWMLGSWGAACVAPVFAALVHALFVRPEERLLRDRFGEAFERYRRRVRPWV